MPRKTHLEQNLELIELHTTAPTPEATRKDETTIPAIEAMVRRIHRLVAADAETAQRDGYSATTPGNGNPGGSGGRQMLVQDDDGHDELIPTTSTESDAISNIDDGRPTDSVHDIRMRVEANTRIVAQALAAIAADLVRFDNYRSLVKPHEEYCFVAKVVHRLPWDDRWRITVRTQFSGIIDHPWREKRGVCAWTYEFTRDHRRLPTEEEMRQYLQTGYVKVRVQAGAR